MDATGSLPAQLTVSLVGAERVTIASDSGAADAAAGSRAVAASAAGP